jgi:hypothetical protein
MLKNAGLRPQSKKMKLVECQNGKHTVGEEEKKKPQENFLNLKTCLLRRPGKLFF